MLTLALAYLKHCLCTFRSISICPFEQAFLNSTFIHFWKLLFQIVIFLWHLPSFRCCQNRRCGQDRAKPITGPLVDNLIVTAAEVLCFGHHQIFSYSITPGTNGYRGARRGVGDQKWSYRRHGHLTLSHDQFRHRSIPRDHKINRLNACRP